MKIKIPKTTKSSQIVASIDDLLTEILLRLPIKSLLQFKIVSKQWHSLITNPEFDRLRHRNHNTAIGLFLPITKSRYKDSIQYVPFFPDKDKLTLPSFRKLDFTNDSSGIKILKSCNGLLLCSSRGPRGNNTRRYVYNPTTNQFSVLPKLLDGVSTSICGMSLAFDPARSPHYKVVCVRKRDHHHYQMEIYSSETGVWRPSGEPFTARVNFEKGGVYWNGAVHWIGCRGGNSLYFDIHRHKLEIMPKPPRPNFYDDESSEYYLGESCDHLHYIEICKPYVLFDVCELERDYLGWLVKYRVDLSVLFGGNGVFIRGDYHMSEWYFYAFSIFSMVRGKTDEDSFLVLQIPGKIIRFNLVSRTFEKVLEFEGMIGDVLRYPARNGFQYIKSLSCV